MIRAETRPWNARGSDCRVVGVEKLGRSRSPGDRTFGVATRRSVTPLSTVRRGIFKPTTGTRLYAFVPESGVPESTMDARVNFSAGIKRILTQH